MKLLFSYVLLLFAVETTGQITINNLSLTDSTLSFLYIGVDNMIKVTGVNEPYNVVITGGSASLTKYEKNEYIVRTNAITDSCELIIRKGSRNVIRKIYKVRTITEPIATLAGLKDTTMRVSRILANPFISVITPGCYFEFYFRIVSFRAIFIQNTDSISTKAVGNQFSSEQIRLIKTLNSNDRIYFDDIRLRGGDSRTVRMSPFWIRIE